MKNFIITALIASAFAVTFYMDTHNGQLPWNDNNNKQIRYYNNHKTKYNNYDRYNRSKYANKPTHYSHHKYSSRQDYKRTRTNNVNSEFIKYRSELYMNLRDAWNLGKNIDLPKPASPTIILVDVHKKGNRYITLDKSSGSADFDKVATEFVQNNINLIKPLPKNFNSDFLKIRIHLNIDTFGISTSF